MRSQREFTHTRAIHRVANGFAHPLFRKRPPFRSILHERTDTEVRARVAQTRDSANQVRSSRSSGRAIALRRDARRGRRFGYLSECAHELPVGDSRQCEASIERHSAVWVCVPSGARGAAVAYAEGREMVFRDDGSSVG